MSSPKSKLRFIPAFMALVALAVFADSCRGFFVNPTLTSMQIGPSNLQLAPATSYQMVATGTYSDGSTSDITAQSTWTSSAPGVANFSSPGNIASASLANLTTFPGTTSVTASDGTVTASAVTVTVCPTVESMTLTIQGGSSFTTTTSATVNFDVKATFGGVTGTQDVTNDVTWNIANTSVLASISGDSGTTIGAGSTTITASLCGTTSNSVTLTVTQ